ncbi:MAG: tyrosine-type recombinase/integrase, partial [Ruminococcus sp.]
MERTTYHDTTDTQNILKLREILRTLPDFAKDYFRAIDATTTTKTRISYAYDIRIFFQFLISSNPLYRNLQINDFTLDMLDQVQALDIEEYMEYLKVYQDGEDSYITNGERGLKRKISALRSFYSYYFKHEMIKTNPTVLIDMPKIHEKAIVRLDADEVALLLDYVEHCGDTLTGQKKAYYEKTKERDLALITLLLGTGIRVSECVGLDLEDLDIKNNAVIVKR